ncbi:MAG: hypothetical protein K2J80_12200 [Oscillospiraceae bacterium]|nr:hypothetical protein [Oscillospiraceae bacterium]
MMHFVSEIFVEEPQQWGLRGDPFLWRYLMEQYGAVAVPYPIDDLKRNITAAFERFAGEPLVLGCICRAPKFAKTHVGMSTGGLSGDFWLQTAIPLLSKRLEKLNLSTGEI